MIMHTLFVVILVCQLVAIGVILRQTYIVHCYLAVTASKLSYIEQWILQQKGES